MFYKQLVNAYDFYKDLENKAIVESVIQKLKALFPVQEVVDLKVSLIIIDAKIQLLKYKIEHCKTGKEINKIEKIIETHQEQIQCRIKAFNRKMLYIEKKTTKYVVVVFTFRY